MATITLKKNPIHTAGNLPAKGAKAPDFKLVAQDLSEKSLKDFAGKKKLLNIFPSMDTAVCALSVQKFHEQLANRSDVVTLNVSLDLPFAAGRFCAAHKLNGAMTLSAFRSSFPDDYGVRMSDGPIAGLCARAVVCLDAQDKVVYVELVPEIAQEPNYAAALAAL